MNWSLVEKALTFKWLSWCSVECFWGLRTITFFNFMGQNIVSPIKLQRYRTFQRSKVNYKTCKDQYFVVHLHIGSFSNVRLRCNFMGQTIVSPIKLQRYRKFQRSKVNYKTCKDQYFVVHLHIGSFSNVCLRCNFMGLTIVCPIKLK